MHSSHVVHKPSVLALLYDAILPQNICCFLLCICYATTYLMARGMQLKTTVAAVSNCKGTVIVQTATCKHSAYEQQTFTPNYFIYLHNLYGTV